MINRNTILFMEYINNRKNELMNTPYDYKLIKKFLEKYKSIEEVFAVIHSIFVIENINEKNYNKELSLQEIEYQIELFKTIGMSEKANYIFINEMEEYKKVINT